MSLSDIKIGVDIVYVPRIKKILNSDEKLPFIKRVLSKAELKEFLRYKRGEFYLAGRFALKESLIKLIGERKNVKFSEISCIKKNGRPELNFSGKTKLVFAKYDISFSITHDNEYALAVAIGRKRG